MTTKTTKTTATPKQSATKPKPAAVKPDYIVIGDRMVVTVQPSEFTDGGEFSLTLDPTLNMFRALDAANEGGEGNAIDEFAAMLEAFGSKGALAVAGDMPLSKITAIFLAYQEEMTKRQGADAGE